MNETTMTLVGNLVDDPELRHTSSNIPFANFRVASTSRRFDRELATYVDTQTVYMTVTAWRGLALNVAASLRKGNPVVVQGRYTQRESKQNEQLRVFHGLDALAVGPDLSRGVTSFAKRSHGSFGPTSNVAADGSELHEGDRPGGEHGISAQDRDEAIDAAGAADPVDTFVGAAMDDGLAPV